DLLLALLTPAGYKLRTASGALPALAAVAEERPDLILLDLMMPGMSGFGVCERLRRDPATAGIPVILVSAVSQLEGQERAQVLSADDYLAKPIHPTEVLERVDALLREHSRRQELERGLRDLHALEAGRRAHRRKVLAGMQGSGAGASGSVEASSVLLLMQDAQGTRVFSGDLRQERGEQVVRAANRSEELEARILRQPKPPATP
ncbi:MAG TPA: response regulator, partial [Candidatus Acidoferrum sp.]|nr:response regulator [Candidatus Acidoferrum sp.]